MAFVTVTEGTLEGEIVNNVLGGTYYSFKGIPYAEPPVGDLRFRPPQPGKPWTGTKTAKQHGPICHQYDPLLQTAKQGSEDCLYLNVYTKVIKPSKPLPVMFWIHGGGFTSGSGNDDYYKSDLLVDKDVVVVTINYRLEVLGFLCLDIEEAPGNVGMKDQVAALKWVKENIKNFGGDPNNVTIFGESAGGSCVSFHLVSPMSKGLFQRAIIQSGSSNCFWSTARVHLDRAKALACKLGKVTEDPKELLEFFKLQPIDALIDARADVTFSEKNKPMMDTHWCVVDEKKIGNNERFFYGNGNDVLKNGIHKDVEVIIGHNADEGLMMLAIGSLEEKVEKFNNYLESFVPLSMTWNLSLRKQLEVGRKFKEYYCGKDTIDPKNVDSLSRYSGMEIFNFPIIQWTKACASKKTKIYFYLFNLYTEKNILAQFMKAGDIVSKKNPILHAEDLFYLFINTAFAPAAIDKNAESYKSIDKMTRLWTNFAKYGNPTPDDALGLTWKPFTLEKQDYLEINEPLMLKSFPNKEEVEFWEDMYKEYQPEECANI